MQECDTYPRLSPVGVCVCLVCLFCLGKAQEQSCPWQSLSSDMTSTENINNIVEVGPGNGARMETEQALLTF